MSGGGGSKLLTDKSLFANLELATLATLATDTTGKILFANAHAVRIFGYPRAVLVGMALDALIPAELRSAHHKGFAEFLKKPTTAVLGPRPTLRALHRDGHQFPIDVRAAGALTREGQRLYCAVRDVSEIPHASPELEGTLANLERKLEAASSEARLRTEQLELFVRHAPAAIAMLDRDMCYMMVSQRYLSDFGLLGKDVIGKCHYDVFPEIREERRPIHRRALAGETIGPEEGTFPRADGHVDWMRLTIHPWHDTDGVVGGILFFSEVVTARKEAEQRLLESNQLLEQRVIERTAALDKARAAAEAASQTKSWFMAAAGHDLRQPLQATRAYLTALEQKTVGNDDVRSLAARAGESLAQMARILEVLLDLGQIDSGTIKPVVKNFTLHDMVDRSLEANRVAAEAKHLSLTRCDHDCLVRSDPAMLERIVSNLIANAVRYTEQGGVVVSCETQGDTVILSVRDTGIGIPQDALDTIFDDYVQLNNEARDRQKGLGLGLSIARRLADLLGHRLSVTSVLGEGSVFSVAIPIGAQAEAKQTVRRETQAVRMPLPHTVALLVDDDAHVRESLAILLDVLGVAVRVAAKGSDALALLAHGLVPDILLTDFRLPDYDGFEVIRRVRKSLGREVPAVVMTGDAAADIGKPPAHTDFLQKPFEIDDLMLLIERAVSLRARD
ncbi:MAG TPA: ATP-binding protein [Rhizomicrobium sp.]|jgi:hypothetical protein|nr:ATP-binding protein [Rhizomicrobium sp.]